MTIELILAALRHTLTAAGVYVVAGGYATEEIWTVVIGAVLTLVGYGWSAWRKYDRATGDF